MGFEDRINSIFGKFDYFKGELSAEVLDIELPEAGESKASLLLERANEGDVVAIYMAGLLVDFLSEFDLKCKEKKYSVLLWSKGSSPTFDCYGNDPTYTIEYKRGKLYWQDKKLSFPEAFSSSFKAVLGKDRLIGELFSYENTLNLAKARLVSMEIDGEIYSWKRVTSNYSSSPLLALSQAIAEHSGSSVVGGIYDGKRFYPNPNHMVDFSSLSLWPSAHENQLEARYIYSLLKDLTDAYAYYMNVGGKSMELLRGLRKRFNYLNKEVIVDVVPKDWVEGTDFVVVEGMNIAKLSNLIFTYPQSISFYLTWGEKSLRSTEYFDTALQELHLTRKRNSDTRIDFLRKDKELLFTYYLSLWEGEFLPLFFKSKYSINSFEEELTLMQEDLL